MSRATDEARRRLSHLFPSHYRELYEEEKKKCGYNCPVARNRALTRLKAKFPQRYQEYYNSAVLEGFATSYGKGGQQ